MKAQIKTTDLSLISTVGYKLGITFTKIDDRIFMIECDAHYDKRILS